MKAKTKILIFPIFLGLILGLFLIPNNVNADSFYNWIQNPSFVQYSDYIEYGGFENAEWEDGEVYGNWTGDCAFSLANPHIGQYSAYASIPAKYVRYDLVETYYTLGSDIEELSYWGGDSVNQYKIFIYYEDTTYEEELLNYDAGWQYIDLTSFISSNKIVVAFRIEGNGAGYYVDDVVLMVDDGEGQDSLSFDTFPWKVSGQRSTGYSLNDIVDLDNTIGRTDSSSLRYEHEDGEHTRQGIGYLDTNLVHYVDAYAYTDDSTQLYIECIIEYSDGTEDSKYVYFNTDGSWTYINFGVSWIDDNKLIDDISFGVSVYSYYTGTYQSFSGVVYIDDVGLWSSVPRGYSRFAFDLVPVSIDEGITYFKAYSQSEYVMNCYVYNETGYLSQNGTYRFSDSFGVKDGDITNGFFDIQLDVRTFTTSPYKLENIVITCFLDDEILTVSILVYWYPIEGGAGEGIDTGDAEETGNLLVNFFMYGTFFIAIPLTITFYVGGANNPSLGISAFVASETLMGAIALSIGFINMWFMIAILVLDVLLIFAMVKGRM